MRKILLALPRLGQVEAEAMFAATMTAAHPTLQDMGLVLDPKVSSLLAFGFNQSWCNFLNDPSYTHFAILHADLEPDLWWMETLLAELEETGADVIHAVAAIKDCRGITSTGIGNAKDKFSRVRRITTTELLEALPPTFGLDDLLKLPGPMPENPCLCPNTGCLLIKRGMWTTFFPGFCISDQVKFNSEHGMYMPETEPEDWNLGRWCHNRGVRVLGTTKVKTNHYGRSVYPTTAAWGQWKTDEQFVAHHG